MSVLSPMHRAAAFAGLPPSPVAMMRRFSLASTRAGMMGSGAAGPLLAAAVMRGASVVALVMMAGRAVIPLPAAMMGRRAVAAAPALVAQSGSPLPAVPVLAACRPVMIPAAPVLAACRPVMIPAAPVLATCLPAVRPRVTPARVSLALSVPAPVMIGPGRRRQDERRGHD